MIFKHSFIVLVGVLLLIIIIISIPLDITSRIHLQPAGATKDAIFGDILNNTNKHTTTTTITSPTNNTNRTAKGPTTDEMITYF